MATPIVPDQEDFDAIDALEEGMPPAERYWHGR
jgi:hypothetical protein